jgi:hypothetical protein
LHVDIDHANIDDFSNLDDFRRLLNKFVRQLAEMHQPVLMHTDINKSSKICDVAYGSFKHLAHFEVLNVTNIFREKKSRPVFSWIASGAF